MEIETGKSDIERNILKNLGPGFIKIIILPLSAKAKAETIDGLKRIPYNGIDKIEVLELK